MPSLGRLRYLDTPASPSSGQGGRTNGTLVLLHGFPLTAEMWEPQLAIAERGWRVIAPHLGGAGGGEPPFDPSAVSIDDYAAEVIDLIDALHLGEVVVGGLSMGGYVALAMFRHAPRYFRGLVLADTRAQADTPEGRDGRTRMLALLAERGVSAVVDEMLPKLLGETTRRERPEVAGRIHALAAANSAATVTGMIHALMTRPDRTGLLASIHCPTLIMVGEEDALTPAALSQDLQRAIGGSELATIAGAGHMSNLERPRAFNEALGRFLDDRV